MFGPLDINGYVQKPCLVLNLLHPYTWCNVGTWSEYYIFGFLEFIAQVLQNKFRQKAFSIMKPSPYLHKTLY
jgi:hypothetical protein